MLWLLSSLSVIPVIAIPQLHSDRWVHPDPTSNLMFEHLTSNLMFEHPTRTNSHSWLSNRNIQLPYTGLPLLGLNQNKKDTFYQASNYSCYAAGSLPWKKAVKWFPFLAWSIEILFWRFLGIFDSEGVLPPGRHHWNQKFTFSRVFW